MAPTYQSKQIVEGPGIIKNLAPYKYPWAFRVWEVEFNNNWSPKEQGMGTDVQDYGLRLTEDEKRLFFTMLSTLTTTDIVVAENIALSLMRHITAPEVSLYLGRQIGTETLHSVSYQFIIETLNLDQEEVYSLYIHRQAIKQKFELAQMFSDILYRAVNVRDVLKGYIFWSQFVEGVWFMAGFAALMSLPRRNLMRGTGTQGSYINRDEQLHVDLGARIINTIMDETGCRPTTEEVYHWLQLALESEYFFADNEIPSVLGYNASLHKEYCLWLANKRLEAMGYPAYNAQRSHPLPWIDEMLMSSKERNFFEATVTEYQSAHSLNW